MEHRDGARPLVVLLAQSIEAVWVKSPDHTVLIIFLFLLHRKESRHEKGIGPVK